ncbi:MAG: hypothetical protein P8Y97_17480, partial [Candidatus Lokiarchaeota archaeon]
NSPIRTPNIENKSDSKKRKKLLKVVEIIEPNHATPETSSIGEFKSKRNTKRTKSTSVKNNKSEVSQIEGSIKRETPKALLITLGENKEIWFPKSTIKAGYVPEKEIVQQFFVDSWVLEKNITA